MARLLLWVVTTILVLVLTSAMPLEDDPDAEDTFVEQDLEADLEADINPKVEPRVETDIEADPDPEAESRVEVDIETEDEAESRLNLLGGQKNEGLDAATWGATTIYVIMIVTASIAVGGLIEGLKEDKDNKFKRSLTSSSSSWLDSPEAIFALSYLTGDYGCLNLLACEGEGRAPLILRASRNVLFGAKILKPVFGSSLDDFEHVVDDFQHAMKYGKDGGNCTREYACSSRTWW